MKITEIRTRKIKHYLFVEVFTDSGIKGLGEAGNWAQLSATEAAIHKFGDAATAAETGKPFGIDHYTGRCVQCRCCEDICPTGALTLSTDVFAADVTKRGRSERIPMKPRARKENDPKSIVNAMSTLLNVPNVYER